MHDIITMRPLDIVVLTCYLVGIAGLGIYFIKKNKTTEDYFLGGRSFPGWAVGLSMMGTSISAVTFLAYPAAAFKLDWRQLFSNLPVPFVALFAIFILIPIFRGKTRTTAFEYLEERFGPLIRLYGAVSYIVLQLLRLGSILYLVAIPIHFLTGVHILFIIMAGGIFIAIYTVAGGIEAVIWTDVIQSIVLVLGGITCLIVIVIKLPGGISEILSVGIEAQKFSPGPMEFNFSERTFWTVIFLGLFSWIGDYSANQSMIQRYFAASSTREARKATAIYMAVGIPTWVFYFFLGTSLFVFYKAIPDSNAWAMEPDQVLPYFILTSVPAGISGIILAGVISAAMSSLDSSINAVATVSVVDIFKRFSTKDHNDGYYLRLARWLSIITALFMIGGAIIFYLLPKETMFDLLLTIVSIFAGCVTGMFLIGFFTTRVNYKSALIAMIISISLNVYLLFNAIDLLPESISINIHSYWANLIVNVTFMFVAYVLSLIHRTRPQKLSRLTIWTMK